MTGGLQSALVIFLIAVIKMPNRTASQRKYLYWLVVSEGSLHCHLVSKFIILMVDRNMVEQRQRKGLTEGQVTLKGCSPATYFSRLLSFLESLQTELIRDQ